MRALTHGSSDATAESVRFGRFGAKGADSVVTQVGGGAGGGAGGGGGGGGPAKCSTLEAAIAMRRSGGGKVVIEQDNLVSFAAISGLFCFYGRYLLRLYQVSFAPAAAEWS